jgi:hypothetical protein
MFVWRAGWSLAARHIQPTRHPPGLAYFTIQFIERIEDVAEDLVTAGRETVHTRRLGTLRLRRTKPATGRHARQHRIQRARTQAIPVMVQFFEHPLAIDPLFGGVVKNVDLPEGEKELANDWVTHHAAIITLHIRSRISITAWLMDN